MRSTLFACLACAAAIPATALAESSDGKSAAAFLNPPGICPPGWSQATPPVNPALGCLPNQLYVPTGPDGLRNIPEGRCPEGWRPATPPLNPLLVCLPTMIAQPEARTLTRDPGLAVSRADGLLCPRHWSAVSRLKHGALICLPRAILAELPDPAGPGVPPGECPEGWRPVTPPLNPVLGCLPDTLVTPD